MPAQAASRLGGAMLSDRGVKWEISNVKQNQDCFDYAVVFA